MAGRRCAGRLAAGSRLGRTGAGLHSRCASGPRPAALRLAGPIDSLVRVSRRVGRARDNRPRTRGAVTRSTPGAAGSCDHTAATESGRGGQGSSGLPGDPARTGELPPGAGAARRPFLGRLAGATRPGCRLSDRDPRRSPGLAGVTPPGRPLPALAPTGRGRRAREKCTRPSAEAPPGPAAPEIGGVRGPRWHRAGRAESPGPDLRGPPVCFSTASRTLELSLQSAFQLSLTVLVLYRSRAGI